jgi:pimeloyl-ACP methyl ester carboxylesterase
MTLPVVYLHGFASGPASSKAKFFARRFAEIGVPVKIPQLDEGDFEQLTITGQLAVIDRAVGGLPAILMGSSLGGYLAALYAGRHPEIDRLVLLAPAFQFPSRWRSRIGPAGLAEWKRQGTAPFFHYSAGGERQLGYGFVEDAARYEDEPDFRQPALVLHGANDTVVPVDASTGFAARHPNVTVKILNSGHELTDVLEDLWMATTAFLGFQNQ